MDGVDGLDRIARKTRRPRACLAWCEALADQGNWTAALKACDAAARLVRQSHWRGELVDGAAVAAQDLGRPDLSKRLEVAWRAAPTLTRLLRWLVSDSHELKPIRTKTTRALARGPKTAARQIWLLRVLVGEVTGDATALSNSRASAGRTLTIPAHRVPVAGDVVVERDDRRCARDRTRRHGRDPLESFGMTEEDHEPRLTTPSIVTVIQGARPGIALTDPDRDAAIDAMRITAEKRVEGRLGNSRRRHYGHAALLVASCVAFAPKSRAAEFLKWAMELRQQYWRRHAFREELARACESLGVSVPA